MAAPRWTPPHVVLPGCSCSTSFFHNPGCGNQNALAATGKIRVDLSTRDLRAAAMETALVELVQAGVHPDASMALLAIYQAAEDSK